MFSLRVQELARQLREKEITPEQVPQYDVDTVQECLLTWWLELRQRREAA